MSSGIRDCDHGLNVVTYPLDRNNNFMSTSSNYTPGFWDQRLATSHPTAEDLTHLKQIADSRAQAHGLPESQFIGTFSTGAVSAQESASPISVMFHCIWPPELGSRHALIRMLPSTETKDLGRALDRAFDIVNTGGAVKNTEIVWVDGARSSPEDRRAFDRMYSRLGQFKDGIVEVYVESIEEALTCACGSVIPEKPWVLQRLRMRCDERMFRSVCSACHEDAAEAADRRERARRSQSPPPSWAEI